MKNTIVLIAIIFSFSIVLTSCKDTKKVEAEVENHDGHDHNSDEMAANEVYQCPMDCEKGKTYEEAGSCPVCKMDLKANASEEGEIQHTENCKCKAAGECTCADGKCECQAEIASMTKNSKNCESGKCECKA
ncbi:heavy metal-binding domain-containing protein [Lutibacter sp.]|uniref:heavy metal-binding domain-containing protein n=1 Tax=Lutibacter sp. TaxID=1925666 RepID=UPI002736124F|nr:heavy metal-binding domain-containing protein [Lutibacter sp.]MDP3313205.1 heavy metal-binding domain-containing protein [Lutibacter sp.]